MLHIFFYHSHLNPNIRFVSFNNYQIPTILEYFIKPTLPPIAINNSKYHPVAHEVWHKNVDLRNKDLYYVGSGSDISDSFSVLCSETEKIREFHAKRQGEVIKIFSLYLCRDFKGKIRPLPTIAQNKNSSQHNL